MRHLIFCSLFSESISSTTRKHSPYEDEYDDDEDKDDPILDDQEDFVAAPESGMKLNSSPIYFTLTSPNFNFPI